MGFLDKMKEANEKIQKDAEQKREHLKELKQEQAEKEMEKGNLIFNTKDNIEDLRNKNMFSLMDVQMQEAGSAWSKLGSTLSVMSRDLLPNISKIGASTAPSFEL